MLPVFQTKLAFLSVTLVWWGLCFSYSNSLLGTAFSWHIYVLSLLSVCWEFTPSVPETWQRLAPLYLSMWILSLVSGFASYSSSSRCLLHVLYIPFTHDIQFNLLHKLWLERFGNLLWQVFNPAPELPNRNFGYTAVVPFLSFQHIDVTSKFFPICFRLEKSTHLASVGWIPGSSWVDKLDSCSCGWPKRDCKISCPSSFSDPDFDLKGAAKQYEEYSRILEQSEFLISVNSYIFFVSNFFHTPPQG